MPFHAFRKIANTALAASLLAAPFALRAQIDNDSPQISTVLSQAETNARLVADDADQLQSYTHNRLSWQSHAQQLEKMKAHVNDLIADVNQLKSLRAEGSPWQQEAIDQVDPLLQAMADHLSATIQHLNEHQSQVHMKPYQDYVHGNQVLAERTLGVIHDFVDYDKASAEADLLEQKLNLPSEPGDSTGL